MFCLNYYYFSKSIIKFDLSKNMENEDEKVTLASLKARNNQNDEDEDNVQSRSKVILSQTD